MNSSQSQYTNIAFISYKREDEQWAKWLQKKLEHYKLPTEIRKQNLDLEFSKNPRHVFRDTTDLSGGVLAKAIKDGLDSSKFLIVICSPRAAKSEWVCKEVQAFIDSGREKFIIPFIIDGEPYAKNPENECFPEALKTLAGERELLGININENGRDSAAVKVVAQLFGLRFDTLWDRFQRETKKKRHYITGAFVAAIIFLLAIIAAGAWAYRQIDHKNWRMMENQSRFVAEEAAQLAEEGDACLAKLLLINTIPSNLNKPSRPLTSESVVAMGRIYDKSRAIINGHTNVVNSASYSPDGKTIVSASEDRTLRIWDVATGVCLNTMEGHTSYVNSSSYSPDGKSIISASFDKTVRIWDAPPSFWEMLETTRERFKNRQLTPEERHRYYMD